MASVYQGPLATPKQFTELWKIEAAAADPQNLPVGCPAINDDDEVLRSRDALGRPGLPSGHRSHFSTYLSEYRGTFPMLYVGDPLWNISPTEAQIRMFFADFLVSCQRADFSFYALTNRRHYPRGYGARRAKGGCGGSREDRWKDAEKESLPMWHV